MANVVIFESNRHVGDTTWLAQYFGAQTSTAFEILDERGNLRSYNEGTGFTYNYNGFFNGGTVTAEYKFTASGKLAMQLTDLNVDVATRNNLLSVGTSSYNFIQYLYRADDNITGSAGDDKVYGSKGNDTINGGNGSDVLTFLGFDSAVRVDLSTGQAITWYGTSSVANIEDIEGSDYHDALTGNALNNQIQGFLGNDEIDGGAGTDTVIYTDASSAVSVNLATHVVSGGSGADTLSSIERVVGSRFADTLTGSTANESFCGGFGSDTINGGSGVDTVEYINVGYGVAVNLTTCTAIGGAGNDVIYNIDNIIGSIFNDTLTGNSGANNLLGSSGADILYGMAGNDLLRGGTGNDVLYGGSGLDIFRFDTTRSTSTVQNRDQIMDFVVADDTIQLENAIFTKLTTTGALGSGNFISNNAPVALQANDYILYDRDGGKLYYDADGSGSGAAVQFATIGINLDLTNADFIVT